MPRTPHARPRPAARRDRPAVAGERTQQASLRVALLALAIAHAGSEGISREDLAALPFVRALYRDHEQARYAALRRDMLILTGAPVRAQRQNTADVRAVHSADTTGAIELPVFYDSALGRYRLRDAGAGPLRLSAEALETLCVVARALHGGAGLPGGRELFSQLAESLGEEDRQKLSVALYGEMRNPAPSITLEFGLRDTIGGLELVLTRLWHAWRQRQTVQFSYRAGGKITTHFGDEVLEIWLADHAYAGVWCEEANKPIELRLDRIVPDTLSVAPPMARGRSRRSVPIRYTLDASVARSEVTERLEGQTVQWEENGTAIVSGRARSLFWARRLLLSYGGSAQALEPPTLVAEMRREAERMHKLYVSPE